MDPEAPSRWPSVVPKEHWPEKGVQQYWQNWGYQQIYKVGEALGGGSDGASIGITNVKQDLWDKVAKTHPGVVAGRQWTDVIDDDELSTRVTASRLSDILDDMKVSPNHSDWSDGV